MQSKAQHQTNLHHYKSKFEFSTYVYIYIIYTLKKNCCCRISIIKTHIVFANKKKKKFVVNIILFTGNIKLL